MKTLGRVCCLLMLLLSLCSCGERVDLAPVVELNGRLINSKATQHVVTRGETLYAISFRYDKDYRQLAAINHLQSPYTLRVGQVLQVKSSVTSQQRPVWTVPERPVNPIIKSRPLLKSREPYTRARSVSLPPSRQYTGWLWPIRGRIAASYVPQQGKKGIDIAGTKGEQVHAAAAGVVAYAGSGIMGYGNLIIIKHDNQYLTAYGNNWRNLVREGQHIQAGQAIAEIGVVDRRYWGVHFEIRKAGKPVNPMNYLQKG